MLSSNAFSAKSFWSIHLAHHFTYSQYFHSCTESNVFCLLGKNPSSLIIPTSIKKNVCSDVRYARVSHDNVSSASIVHKVPIRLRQRINSKTKQDEKKMNLDGKKNAINAKYCVHTDAVSLSSHGQINSENLLLLFRRQYKTFLGIRKLPSPIQRSPNLTLFARCYHRNKFFSTYPYWNRRPVLPYVRPLMRTTLAALSNGLSHITSLRTPFTGSNSYIREKYTRDTEAVIIDLSFL